VLLRVSFLLHVGAFFIFLLQITANYCKKVQMTANPLVSGDCGRLVRRLWPLAEGSHQRGWLGNSEPAGETPAGAIETIALPGISETPPRNGGDCPWPAPFFPSTVLHPIYSSFYDNRNRPILDSFPEAVF
jgi:hypothetical protein